MAFDITENARNAASQLNVQPVTVLEIDGYPIRFGTSALFTFIRIGDVGLEVDNYLGAPWVIGGFRKLEDQNDYISFGGGGGSGTIVQSLRPDRGAGSSVTRMNLSLIDKNQEISKLISPGFDLPEILGRNVVVYQGFKNTSFPEDYVVNFRGSIASIDSGPGLVTFGLSGVEEKKRQGIYRKKIAELTTAFASGDAITTIDVGDASDFLLPITGPDGTEDSAVTFYVKVGDEIFGYTGTTASSFTGVTRAQLGSIATDHDIGDRLTSLVRFEENGVQLALKIMLSGQNGFYLEDLEIASFNFISIDLTVANSIFIRNVDLPDKYGVFIGDYVTITGATTGGNNQAAIEILDIQVLGNGTYLVLDGTFSLEIPTAATVSFRSQYDTLPEGLALLPLEVDVAEHDRLFRLFLSSFDYDFKIEDISDTKKFLDEQIYLPMPAFSVPRKGRASMGYTIGPIPGSNIVTLDRSNITNANKLKLSRSLNRNFSNSIRYNTNKNPVTGDFDEVFSYEDATSKSEIPVGDKTQTVNADGMNSVTTQAETRSLSASNRWLKRYSRGAEYLKNVKVQYGTGYPLEIGDIVLFDTNALNVTDTEQGSRNGALRFMEIVNKSIDNGKGDVTLELINTAIDVDERYGLISPCSLIKSATNAQQFVIKKSFFTDLLTEGRKWQDLVGASIKVRSVDSSTVSSDSVISAVIGDEIFLETPLDLTPSADQIMELSEYDLQPQLIKLIYAYFSDGTNNFADGEPPYVFL